MESRAALLSSKIDKASLTQKELWRWKYFLYPDISLDIPMEKMPIDVEELMRKMQSQEGFKPWGKLFCAESPTFIFKSGVPLKYARHNIKEEEKKNEIARYCQQII